MKTPAFGWLRIGGPKVRRTLVAATMVAGVLQLSSGESFAVQFCNTTPIVGTGGTGPSAPYPSNIVVTGLSGTIIDVNVTLFGVTTRGDNNNPPEHYVEDLDVLVAGPTGANVILMSDAGGDNVNTQGPVVNANLTFDDQAANQLPADTGPLVTGTYRPVDDDDDAAPNPVDSFPPPAPALSNATGLNTFNGLNPNGTYSLFAVDDQTQAPVDINGGWCIDILTTGGGGTTTTSSTTTTTLPGTSTTSSTTTTLPATTTTSSTTTTLPATTTTSSTTTTLPATTTTSSTTTTLPATTTTTGASTTTSTTQLSGNTCRAQLLASQAQMNSRLNASRSFIQLLPAVQSAPLLSRLDAQRAQANAGYALALAFCPN